MISTGSAEKIIPRRPLITQKVEVNKGLKINPDGPVCISATPNVAVFDDVVPLSLIRELREELSENIREADFEDKRDEFGSITYRWKFYHPPLGSITAATLLTNPEILDGIKHICDYSFRVFFNGYADEFEVALVRYPAGGFYRWHTDHQLIPGIRRVMIFILFLTDDCGGNFEINTMPLTNEMLEDRILDRIEAEAYVEPRAGRFVLVPPYLVHRVAPVTAPREILLGHVHLGI